MKKETRRSAGWVLIAVGLIITACSQQIVFPGLERLIGIETIVGSDNVMHLPDGGYAYTNPRAMVRWIASIAAVGFLLAFTGAFMLFRARLHHRSSEERAKDQAD